MSAINDHSVYTLEELGRELGTENLRDLSSQVRKLGIRFVTVNKKRLISGRHFRQVIERAAEILEGDFDDES